MCGQGMALTGGGEGQLTYVRPADHVCRSPIERRERRIIEDFVREVDTEAELKQAEAEADASLTRHRAEGDLVAAGVVSGAPAEMARRPVRIYQQSQESTQSAKSTR